MNRQRSLLLWLLLASLQCGLFASAAEQPNIVFLLADDFGYGDLACYGHPYARTPNLDRLALQGTIFRQFYSTGVTCCPARTGLMTSKFPATFATYPANGGFGDRVSITELLKRAGYATGHFGKWHIGPDPKPGNYGIDVIGADTGGRRNASGGRDSHIYDAAIQFMEQHRNGPFYMQVWGHISHFPVNPNQTYVDKFKDLVVDETKFDQPMREKFAECKQLGGDVSDHMRRYLGDVYSLDEDVGRLLKRIDELGLTNNTMVVFSSDQGPADLRFGSAESPRKKKKNRNKAGGAANDTPEIRLNAMGHTSGLRGGKHGMYEGGVRVPFIVRWPGHVPEGRVDEKSVICGIDWLPTLCAITGVKSDSEFDGEDVSKSWLGGQHVRTKPLFWKTSSPGSDAGIRVGQWKLIHPTRRRGEVELYDLVNDAAENHNVAAQHTDVVKELTAKIESWTVTLPKEYLKSQETEN